MIIHVLLLVLSQSTNADQTVTPSVAGWTSYIPDPSHACGNGASEIRGDFDGDGKTDIARLQINQKTHRRRVAVWMNGRQDPIVLTEDKAETAGDFLVLEKPRQLVAFDGVSGHPYTIVLPSIGYAKCESSERVFQWNSPEKRFVSTQVSD